MRRLIVFALVAAGLVFGAVGSFAATTKPQTKQMATSAGSAEIKGEVTKITAKTLWVKDDTGKSHRVIVSNPKMMEGIKVGDKVDVKKEKGKVASIEKMESMAPPATEGSSGTK